jgi:hypothetical protein
MTEEKDKGNGKDQQVPVQPVDGIDTYLIIGRFRNTGQITLAGQPIEDLIKFRERKTREELLDVLLDAMIVVRNLSKQVQKKSPILQLAKSLILPGR